jgi:hypothetical protein
VCATTRIYDVDLHAEGPHRKTRTVETVLWLALSSMPRPSQLAASVQAGVSATSPWLASHAAELVRAPCVNPSVALSRCGEWLVWRRLGVEERVRRSL